MAKIRTDFVTNSSSSSFILGFKDEDSINNQLNQENLPDKYKSRLLRDIKEHNISKDTALAVFEDEMKFLAKWKAEEKLGYYGFRKLEEQEIDALASEIYSKWYEIFSKRIEKYGYLALVEYDDHQDDELEWSIVPKLKCKVQRFSHH